MIKLKVVLASGSPRRIELLKNICEEFEVHPSQADETLPGNIGPADGVELLADRKCAKIAPLYGDALVIGADTVVVLDGLILGKPRDREDSARMLRLLAGTTHTVMTGVCLAVREKGNTVRKCLFHQSTDVTFYPMRESDIAWYLDTGEGADKAGAYGIQEKGALLVRGIVGDYFNVMGFPLARAARKMREILE